MKTFKLIIGIMAACLLTAINVMAYEVVVHNYTDEPMQVDITGENLQAGYNAGSCTVTKNTENIKCSVSPIGTCIRKVSLKWDDRKGEKGNVVFSGGSTYDLPGYPVPNFVCYNVYYEIKYNYKKTGISFERRY
jgi:hypothetical protein